MRYTRKNIVLRDQKYRTDAISALAPMMIVLFCILLSGVIMPIIFVATGKNGMDMLIMAGVFVVFCGLCTIVPIKYFKRLSARIKEENEIIATGKEARATLKDIIINSSRENSVADYNYTVVYTYTNHLGEEIERKAERSFTSAKTLAFFKRNPTFLVFYNEDVLLIMSSEQA